MGFPLQLAARYMGAKKRAFISMGTFFAILGVALGVAGLATAISVTGGFRKQFRDKVLGVNAHVLILKRSSYFTEYRELMERMKAVPEVTGIAPFTIHPMMVTRGDRTATGVLLKGIDPDLSPRVLDLPGHITHGSLSGLRLPGALPPEGRAPLGGNDRGSTLLKIEPTPSGKDSSEARGALLDEVRKIIAEEAQAARNQPEEATSPPQVPEGAPMGNIVPEGGYQSQLPDEDVIPDSVNPDPCSDASSTLPGIVIGSTLGKNLKAGLGDCVQVTSPTIGFSFSGDGIRAPLAKQFRVIAVFDAGFDQYDAKLVYTDLYQAQEFADAGDSVTGIEMRVRNIDRAREVADQIDKTLSDGLHYTMDWEELNRGLFTALRIQQILMSLVLGLIIVVAAFTVIATLIMVVLDKKKEIAVLKAMGAKDSSVMQAFLYQGAIIGVLGASLGIGLALLVVKVLIAYAIPLDPKVYFISRLPVDARPVDFAFVFVFAVLVCVLATLWPAAYAARLRFPEAFREQ